VRDPFKQALIAGDAGTAMERIKGLAG